MKIGVTSQNFRTITGHAGSARRFMIFEAAGGEILETEKLDLPMELSIHEHPSGAAHPIDGLDVLITGGCGEGFLHKLTARGIKVILTSETDPKVAASAVAAGAPLPPPVPEEGGHEGCGCRCASHGA